MEYEKREIIPFDKKEISDKHILVATNSTCFVNRSNIQKLELQELTEKIKLVRKLAKEKGAKIKGVNEFKKQIIDNYAEYESEANKYIEKFTDLGNAWKNHILHMGINDDIYYTEYLRNLEFDLQRMNYRNTTLSKMREANRNIDKSIGCLESDEIVNTIYMNF